jgi:LysR family transcriptional regulator, regulator for bpeEF and oprC
MREVISILPARLFCDRFYEPYFAMHGWILHPSHGSLSINSSIDNQIAMDRLHGILVFLKIMETRNFSEAARSLGVSTSAVSASMLRLEQKLGVRLLNRTTRRVLPTPEGLEFDKRCRSIVVALEQAETSVGRSASAPSGRLRIGMPSGLGKTWVIPHLPQFVSAYPSVSLEIVLGDLLTSSTGEAFDAQIHVGEIRPSRMIVRKLASVNYVVCAAPDYLREKGRPQSPADLKDHRCLSYRRPRNGQIRQWRLQRGRSTQMLTPDNSIIVNSGEGLIAAASAGLGLAQVAEYYARPEMQAGRLVEVMKSHSVHAYDISVVFQQRRRVAPRLRVFVDFLVDMFNPPPWQTR